MNMSEKRLVIVSIVALCGWGTLCFAQQDVRAQRAEMFGSFEFLEGDAVTESIYGERITLNLDDTAAFGFGMGYNISDNFNMNMSFLFGKMDIATSGIIHLSGDASVFMFDTNLDYNLLAQALTPVASAGIGLINLDGDYGSHRSAFNETDLSYNFGAGLRWDFTSNLFVKAMYTWKFTTLEDTDDTLLLDGLKINFGFVF